MKTTETVTLSIDIVLEYDSVSVRDELIASLINDLHVDRATWGLGQTFCEAKSIDGTATVTTKTP